MEWTAIGTAIVGVALGIWGGVKAFSSDQRKQRAEDRRQRKRQQRQLLRAFRWGDMVDGWIAEHRIDDRRHNAVEHPTGEGRLAIAELPPEIHDGIRAFVGDGDDDEGDE